MNFQREYLQQIKEARCIRLFLDYDGTLAEFAPTPDDINPDPQVIALLKSLRDHPKIILAVISGRRLSHIEKLVPIDGIWLAGSYGLEVRAPDGTYIHRADYNLIRPILQHLKPIWAELINGKEGFYLEDKNWSLALHARFAEDSLSDQILSEARTYAKQVDVEGGLKILGGHKFLEIAPKEADKGETVSYLMEKVPKAGSFSIIIGDDDKDERAFSVVQALGGLAGCVCYKSHTTSADFILTSPKVARTWLTNLLKFLE